MTRQCATDDCGNPARPQRRQCDPCRNRQWRQRYRHGSWRTKDDLDIAAIVAAPRPVDGLTKLERLVIAAKLTERDVPAEEIARVVGVTARTVVRWRTSPPKAYRPAA
ncbi:hypothetical protein [Streptomyces sp. NPDC056682]|uniref:hypothetical protein n=1 Tax=Streptomyces sp. NPDC056682 TaxID=3345909 RepID=UPI003693EADF